MSFNALLSSREAGYLVKVILGITMFAFKFAEIRNPRLRRPTATIEASQSRAKEGRHGRLRRLNRAKCEL